MATSFAARRGSRSCWVEIGGEIFIVLEGSLRVLVQPLAREIGPIVRILGPGDISEVAFLTDGLRCASVSAMDDVRLLILDTKALERTAGEAELAGKLSPWTRKLDDRLSVRLSAHHRPPVHSSVWPVLHGDRAGGRRTRHRLVRARATPPSRSCQGPNLSSSAMDRRTEPTPPVQAL